MQLAHSTAALRRARRPPSHRRPFSYGASERVAQLLTRGRAEGWLMNRYGGVDVRTVDAAAWVHDEMVRSPGRLGGHLGWKCGVDGVDAALFPGQQIEERPEGGRFAAPLFGGSVVESGSTVAHARGGMRGVEVELGFVLGSALAARPRQAEPYSVTEVWEAISTVELALEVCASRFTCKVPLAVAVADFGNHHALVRGAPVAKETIVPSPNYEADWWVPLVGHTGTPAVTLLSGSEKTGELTAVDELSGMQPIESLCWLVNYLTGRGVPLPVGTYLLSGGLGMVAFSAEEECWGDIVRVEASSAAARHEEETADLGSVSVTIAPG